MKIGYYVKGAIAGAAFILSGCNTTDIRATVNNGDAVTTTKTNTVVSNASKIKVLHSDHSNNYKVVGRISTQNYNFVGMTISQESILTELKKQAAAMGANGIVNITTGLAQTTAEAVILK